MAVELNSKAITRILATATFAAALAVPVLAISEAEAKPDFLTYSPQLLEDLRGDNQPVLSILPLTGVLPAWLMSALL